MRPRDRVVSHLRAVGEVSDPGGLASTALAEAVGYTGSSVAFAQLLSSMERSGLIEREVRGRRTYLIRLAAAAAERDREPGLSLPARAAAPRLYAESRAAGPRDAEPRAAGIDYDELARWLLAEVTRRLTAGGGAGLAPDAGWPSPESDPGFDPGFDPSFESGFESGFEHARTGDLADTVASLERRLANVESRQRRLRAEHTRLRELLAAARQSLAEQQRAAAGPGGQPGELDAGAAVQLLERLLSSLRGGGAANQESAQAG